MTTYGTKNKSYGLDNLGLTTKEVYWNLTPAELTEQTVRLGQGSIADSGALAVDTGEFTGRSPKDRYIVEDDVTRSLVDWGEINQPYDEEKFEYLYQRVIQYLNDKQIYVRDAMACSNPDYRLKLRVINEHPWQNMFASNMFIRPKLYELADFAPEWTVIAAPNFHADPSIDDTRQHNFSIINFSKKVILIGGSAYTGEIKKGIFSVLNFILPTQRDVLPMHCSGNVGRQEDTAIFFGLSGTGKTTLSNDPERRLIGDDEHGWDASTVFNFEGGCYAKCIGLSPENEPQICDAIRFGAILENINYLEGTRSVDFDNIEKTQNTRVSYPLSHIGNKVHSQVGGVPKNIFFLTYDAFGVIPPISKLNPGQAMYHFISGYTSKVAGTEEGVVEPTTTFSACFGAPFMPLHPTYYAEMLGKKMEESDVNVWLINTGMTGGAYGVGTRIKLADTRAIIKTAINGVLENVAFEKDPVFKMIIPKKCPGVRSAFLNPINVWENKEDYVAAANKLAQRFNDNFAQFADKASDEIMAANPNVGVKL
jgi:phosphoenolpyruvate carboxykinase (ATP)